jgi:thymidylate synthase (FAD)
LEQCGRICYKSEDKITDDSAIPFVKKIAAHGHNSLMEMAVATFRLTCHPDHVLELLSCQPKFLQVDRVDNGMIVTGSIRAFRELYQRHSTNQLVNDLVLVFAAKEPHLFQDVFSPQEAMPPDRQVRIEKLSLKEVESLPEDLLARHRFVGVTFVTNRAISHELVRHRPCSFLQESQRYCRYDQDQFGYQVSFIRPMFYDEKSTEYQYWLQSMELAEKNYLRLLETSTPQAARTVLPNSCKTEIIVYCNLEEWRHILSLRTSKSAEPSMRELMDPLGKELSKRYPFL